MKHFTEEDPRIEQRHQEQLSKLDVVSDKLSLVVKSVTLATVAIVLPLVYLVVKDLM